MRIVHTALRYPPASGGAEKYVAELASRTRNTQQGRDVRVLSSAMRTHGPISYLKPELLLNDPVYLQRLSVSSTSFISYPRLQALSYYIGHHKPDILHSYGYWYQPADVTARYAKKHRIPFIFHPIYYTNAIRRKFIWQAYETLIGKKTFEYADVVAVLSEYEKQLIEKAGYPVKRFEVIPPGIDIAAFAVPQKNIFAEKGIQGSILLSVSRIARSKGLQDTIRALPDVRKRVPDAVLAIVGEDFGYQAELVALAEKIGVAHAVHFLGKLPDTELLAAFQYADVFVHASKYEAFGIVLAEAMAAGLPIVARNATAIPFVVPHEKAGLLFENKKELVQSIISILQIPNLALHLTDYAKNLAHTQYSWDASVAKIISLYDEFKS